MYLQLNFNFFASILDGAFVNTMLERVECNFNLNNQKPIETENLRDKPQSPEAKSMMQTKQIAFA